jgi:hypothetical protein
MSSSLSNTNEPISESVLARGKVTHPYYSHLMTLHEDDLPFFIRSHLVLLVTTFLIRKLFLLEK